MCSWGWGNGEEPIPSIPVPCPPTGTPRARNIFPATTKDKKPSGDPEGLSLRNGWRPRLCVRRRHSAGASCETRSWSRLSRYRSARVRVPRRVPCLLALALGCGIVRCTGTTDALSATTPQHGWFHQQPTYQSRFVTPQSEVAPVAGTGPRHGGPFAGRVRPHHAGSRPVVARRSLGMRRRHCSPGPVQKPLDLSRVMGQNGRQRFRPPRACCTGPRARRLAR